MAKHGLRASDELRTSIDAWARRQPDRPIRSEAIRCSRTLRHQYTRAPSDFDFDAHLHNLAGRYAEIGGGSLGIAQHECEEGFPPHPHARNARCRNDRFPADVVRDLRRGSAIKLRLLLRNANAIWD